MKQVHVSISGMVQGVGYRFFVKSWAKTYGIVGWVINLPDGKVEAVFQGEERNVLKLIEKCRKGPFLAEVKEIIISWEQLADSFNDFQIIS